MIKEIERVPDNTNNYSTLFSLKLIFSSGPEWASYNIGVFLCTRCAGIHRGLGAHISKVKHLKLDRWEDSQVEHMKEVGNVAAKFKYEERVPSCYRRPTEFDPQYAFFFATKAIVINILILGCCWSSGSKQSMNGTSSAILKTRSTLLVS